MNLMIEFVGEIPLDRLKFVGILGDDPETGGCKHRFGPLDGFSRIGGLKAHLRPLALHRLGKIVPAVSPIYPPCRIFRVFLPVDDLLRSSHFVHRFLFTDNRSQMAEKGQK